MDCPTKYTTLNVQRQKTGDVWSYGDTLIIILYEREAPVLLMMLDFPLDITVSLELRPR